MDSPATGYVCVEFTLKKILFAAPTLPAGPVAGPAPLPHPPAPKLASTHLQHTDVSAN